MRYQVIVLATFFARSLPKHGDDRVLDTPTRCSAAAYAFLSKRWLRRENGQPGRVPDSGLAEWGTERWRALFSATVGAAPQELQSIGAALRAGKAARQAERGAKRKALGVECPISSDSE